MKFLNVGIASLILAGIASSSYGADTCSVVINTDLYGNPAVTCQYTYTMSVDNSGNTSSASGNRVCTGNGSTPLGPGSGGPYTGGTASEYILFPNIADVTFNMPTTAQLGTHAPGLVVSLSDRGGSSPVTSSTTDCTVNISGYNGTWQLTPENNSALRLDVAGNGTANGTLLEVYTSNGTTAQQFAFSNAGVSPGGDYNFAKVGGAYCVQPTGTSSGSNVEIWACAGSAAQSWNVVADASPAGYYQLQPYTGPGRCLNATGTTSGNAVTVATCNSTSAQQWTGL